jgi:hypothetical protein
MAKSVTQPMEDLRQEVTHVKQQVERLRLEGEYSERSSLKRWVRDAEAVLARWENAGDKPA